METDGRDNASQPEPAEASNVLRFPRDWFGPTEDLIPVGPRARGAGAVELGVDEPGLPVLTTAEDFWGEGSAAIQHAVQAPRDRAVGPPAAQPAAPAPHWRPEFPAVERAMGQRRPKRRHVAAASVLMACVAGVLGVVWGPPPGSGRLALSMIAPQGGTGALARVHVPLFAGSSPLDRAAQPGTRSRTHASHARTARAGASSRAAVARALRQPPSSGLSAPPHTSQPAVSSTPSYVPAASSDAATAASAGSGSAAAAASPSGPAGPGAAFGPGHLG